MIKFLIKGKITDARSKAINNLNLQAIDSDLGWFKDHNDDLVEPSRTG
jgi:hypothetical protein